MMTLKIFWILLFTSYVKLGDISALKEKQLESREKRKIKTET